MNITKHYLFDFDGTLVDSMPYWAEAMLDVLDTFGIQYGDDIINIITPLGLQGTAEYFQGLGLELTIEEIFAEVDKRLAPAYTHKIPAKANVFHCLQKMKTLGFGLHVLTASPHRWLDPCLVRLGLYDLFDNVWSSDDFGTGKTNPKIYHAAAERMGARMDEITFLDDNINADLAAKTSGVSVIGVYDKTSENDADRMRRELDGYVLDFAELEAMLSK